MSSKVKIDSYAINEHNYVHCTDTNTGKEVCLCERIQTEYDSEQFWIAETTEGNYIIVKEENLDDFYYWGE